jgi:hypothetical protein
MLRQALKSTCEVGGAEVHSFGIAADTGAKGQRSRPMLMLMIQVDPQNWHGCWWAVQDWRSGSSSCNANFCGIELTAIALRFQFIVKLEP